MASPGSLVGRTLGHYRIVEPLGAGGMGVVYLGEDQVLGRKAAIKLLHPESLHNQSAKARFLREARAIAALSHPNVAVLYEIGESEGQVFLAMEYLEGSNLRDRLIAGPIPHERLLQYATALAGALEHAHARGVLHRDIKPANVFLTRDGQLKLLDFGLARLAEGSEELTRSRPNLTAPGTWVGTLQYAAPETLTGHPADVRSDIYSLGVVFYEMACGQLPFAGLEGAALTAAILCGNAPSATQRNSAVAPGLAGVIEKAMAARPEDRFGNAGELLAALAKLKTVTGAAPIAEVVRAPSLAILEFQNVSRDAAMGWLGTGIAETLTTDVRKLNAVRVISPERVQSVLRQNQSAEAAELGRQLGASWVVTGSYQRAGDRLRITPRLIETATGEIISAAKLDGSWDEVFDLQDRVVAELMDVLNVKLDSSALERIASPETLRLEAYEHYAEGRIRLNQLGKTSLEEARQHFEKAIQLDPQYAMAHSGLGATHCMRFIHRTDPDDLTRALGHLERARELDPELADPYPWLSYAYMRQGKLELSRQAGAEGVRRQPDHFQCQYFYSVTLIVGRDVDYAAAAAHLLQATRFEPRFHPAWLVLASVAKQVGDYTRACEFADRAIELEVNENASQRFYGTRMLRASAEVRLGDWEAAAAGYNQALERLAICDHMYRDAFIVSCTCGLGEIELRQQRPDAALASFRRGWQILHEYPRMLGGDRLRMRVLSGMAAAYASSGQQVRGRELVQEFEDSLGGLFAQPHTWIWDASTPELCHSLAVAYACLGDVGSALRSLQQAVEQGWYDARWLLADPELTSLHKEAEFQALITQLQRLPKIQFDPR